MSFRILLAVDGSAIARDAVRHAIDRFGLPDERITVDLLHSHFALPPRAASALGREIVSAYYRDETAQALEGVRRLLDARKVAYRTVARVGSAAAQIVRQAERAQTDLIVMGSHGRGAAKGLLLGSVAQGVIAQCAVPVLLVRDARSRRPDAGVLMAVDGSAYTKRALQWLIEHRDVVLGERELVLIHVAPGESRLPSMLGKKQTSAVQEAEFEQAMAPARRRLGRAAIAWREICTHGDAGAQIADQAQRLESGLVIMGSHGRGGMTSLLLGSVTQRVLSESRVPVLIVR